METAMRNVSINDRRTPSMSPLIKTEPATCQQDQPIDFSTKVRVRTVEAEDTTLRKVSNDSAIDVSDDHREESSNRPPIGPSSTDLVEPEQHPLIGQPRHPPVSMPIPNISSFLPHSSSLPGMGMFYPGGPVFPNFLPPGFTGAPMWPNPMAALMHQQQEAARKLISQAALNNKQSTVGGGVRPQFPKQFFGKHEMMGMAGGGMGRGYPGMPGFPNPAMTPANVGNIPDPGILAEALKSHEEMYTAYKQQVLSQKASEDAKRGPRRQPAATVTNGNHSSASTGVLQQNGSTNSTAPATLAIPENSSSLSQISEDRESSLSPSPPHKTHNPSATEPKYTASENERGQVEGPSSSSSEEDKSSIRGSVGDVAAPAPPTVPSNGNSLPSTTSSAGVSLHSSDESLQTSDGGRRSLTPAHSSNGELNDITGMRPRSMTLPTQMATSADSRLMAHSPSPSVLSTGNNSSGPGTPNSRCDRGFRKRARTLPDDLKIKKRDDAYWERRRKNNEAAKRSRDSRRAKEDEIAIRAAFLEQENIRLRLELASLKTQTAKLRSELIIFQGPEDLRPARSVGPS